MCTGSVPWPYSTAGILSARRIRRAAPLPNSVRNSAVSLTSGTNELLKTCESYLRGERPERVETRTLSITVDIDPRPGNRSTLAHAHHWTKVGAGCAAGLGPRRVRRRRGTPAHHDL